MAEYLITFTGSGQYVPGQQGAIDSDHNMAGSRLPAPRPNLPRHMDSLLKQAPYQMDAVQRDIVLQAIEEVCHYRNCPCWPRTSVPTTYTLWRMRTSRPKL